MIASVLAMGWALSDEAAASECASAEFEESTSDVLKNRLSEINSGSGGAGFSIQAELAPGLSHCVVYRPGPPPVVINSFVMDLGRSDLAIDVVKAADAVYGREKLEIIVEHAQSREGWTPVAAINGGFWNPEERPVGVCAGGGRIYTAASHQWSLLFMEDGKIHIGSCQIEPSAMSGEEQVALQALNLPAPNKGAALYTPEFGSEVHVKDETAVAARLDLPAQDPIRINSSIYAVVSEVRRGAGDLPLAPGAGWLVFSGGDPGIDIAPWSQGREVAIRIDSPSVGGPVSAALSAGPILARNGEMVFNAQDAEFMALDGSLPKARSAIGLSADRKSLILMAIDGSRYGPSRGAKLEELCDEMLAMGAADILNLDGGSSTTAWAAGDLVNRPGGLMGSRPISNALVIFRRNDTNSSIHSNAAPHVF